MTPAQVIARLEQLEQEMRATVSNCDGPPGFSYSDISPELVIEWADTLRDLRAQVQAARGVENYLAIAERIAREAHEGQTCTVTGEPYVHHIERVVTMVEGDEAKAVAWLHDVLEDTDVTASELVQSGIPERVRLAIVALTRRKHQPYTEYIAWLCDHGGALALTVKFADLRDHLRPNCPERLRQRYEAAVEALLRSSTTDRGGKP